MFFLCLPAFDGGKQHSAYVSQSLAGRGSQKFQEV
jgi:hypothetical protein